jgi:hypothetical protein
VFSCAVFWWFLCVRQCCGMYHTRLASLISTTLRSVLTHLVLAGTLLYLARERVALKATSA